MKKLLEKNKGRILMGGHRGCTCQYPENSIEAMREGIRRGADYLEIDVQLTADKVPVIYHDVRLEDRTPLTGYVHEHTYAEMKEVVPGFCTFREAMEYGRDEDVYFGLELKTVAMDMQCVNMELVEMMADILEETGMKENVFVFGIDYMVLKHIKEYAPDVNIGLIVPHVPADPVKLMKDMDAIIYLSYIYNMTEDIVRRVKEAGFYVDGAALRSDKWVDKAKECGCDMFETDYPERYCVK